MEAAEKAGVCALMCDWGHCGTSAAHGTLCWAKDSNRYQIASSCKVPPACGGDYEIRGYVVSHCCSYGM
jgi:hypothetical protein